jgi:hypothetical protein
VFRGSGFGLVGGSDGGGRAATHFGFQKNEGLWGNGLPLVGEWVPAGDDGRKWRWSSAAVTVGIRENARCRWGEKIMLGKNKGERKGFSAGRGDHAAGFGGGSRRRCRWRENLGTRCRWRENGLGPLEGKFLEGCESAIDLCFFFLKRSKQKRRGTCHITFVIIVESRRIITHFP